MINANVFHPAQFSSPHRQFLPTEQDSAEATIRVMLLPLADSQALPDQARPFSDAEIPDVVILTEMNSAQLLAGNLSPALYAILPVIDASGIRASTDPNRRCADLSIASAQKGAIADALEVLKGSIERVRSLAPSVLHSADPRVHLLARLFVSDRGLTPRRDPSRPETVSYVDEAVIANVQGCAEELSELKLVERVFFDRVPVCPRCHSARLSVREQCSVCQSANIGEEAIIHHLRCAYQGLEHEFKTSRGLACPKCRERLEHFGVDYDRPGFVSTCHACGHASSETSVGFICLDCEAEGGALELAYKTIHRYQLTEAGREYLKSGFALPARRSREAGFDGRIHEFVSRHAALTTPCSVLIARFKASRKTVVGCAAERARALYASIIKETFTPETEIIECPPFFFVLLSGDDKRDVEGALPEIRQTLERNFASPMEVDYRVCGPDEILAFLSNEIAC